MHILGYVVVSLAGSFATDVMFQHANGDRPSVPNYLLIMTDGNSDNATLTWRQAMRARASGINIITVSNSIIRSHFAYPHTIIILPSHWHHES